MKSSLKIRHYIIGQMYKSAGKNLKLPSTRELANHFGLATSTIALALAELVKEGMLQPQKGVGFFINGEKMNWPLENNMPKLIGIITGDGKNYYYDYWYWREYSPVVTALIQQGWNVRSLSCDANDEEGMIEELVNANVDAIVWLRCNLSQKGVDRLNANGLPAVLIGNQKYSNAFTLYHDWQGITDFYINKIIEQKYQNITIFMEESEWLEPAQGLRSAMSHAKIRGKVNWINPNAPEMEAQLSNALAQGTDLLLTSLMCHATANRIAKKVCPDVEIMHFGSFSQEGIINELEFDTQQQAQRCAKLLQSAFSGAKYYSEDIPFHFYQRPEYIQSRFE